MRDSKKNECLLHAKQQTELRGCKKPRSPPSRSTKTQDPARAEHRGWQQPGEKEHQPRLQGSLRSDTYPNRRVLRQQGRD